MKPLDVVAFQRLNIGPDGRPLKQSGVLDAATRWALDLESLPLFRQRTVRFGLAHVGETETAPNRGRLIDQWIREFGRDPEDDQDDPWCAIYACLALRAGGIEVAEASVRRLAALFPETPCPLPGDLICLHRPNGTGHVDIITGAGEGIVSVVGGNVNNAVRAGLRRRAGRKCYRVGDSGIPLALGSLPMLGAADR